MLTSALTNQELIRQFEAASLPGECFRHAEHVRVAFLYLQKYPVLKALERFSSGLKGFAAALGNPQLYNETITWAYICLIRERMAHTPHTQTWEEFARNNADLLIWKGGVLERYYKPETLISALAKQVFVLPDGML